MDKKPEYIKAAIYRKTQRGKLAQRKQNESVSGRYRLLKFVAKKQGFVLNITKDQYLELVSKKCYYCNDDLPLAGYGLDRKVNSSGYDIENLIPCCNFCNRIKCHLLSYEEFSLLAPVLKQIKEARRKIQSNSEMVV